MNPERFGPYRFESLIGRGGMGEVFRAWDERRDRVVALKRLPRQMAMDREFRARFQRESALAAKLREPHIIPIHDYGEIDGLLYIDMRLVEGTDLAKVLKAGRIRPERAVDVVSQIADALDAAHTEGLIHRDVKPSNILLVGPPERAAVRGFAYLADFGIASTLGGGSTLSRPGLAVGTAAYMAPERMSGERVDARADVYSTACMLFECLTGHRPFPAADLLQVLRAHMTLPRPRPSEHGAPIPSALDDVVTRGMAMDPNERYSTAGDLAEAARAALATSAPAAPAVEVGRLAETAQALPVVGAEGDASAPAAAAADGRRPVPDPPSAAPAGDAAPAAAAAPAPAAPPSASPGPTATGTGSPNVGRLAGSGSSPAASMGAGVGPPDAGWSAGSGSSPAASAGSGPSPAAVEDPLSPPSLPSSSSSPSLPSSWPSSSSFPRSSPPPSSASGGPATPRAGADAGPVGGRPAARPEATMPTSNVAPAARVTSPTPRPRRAPEPPDRTPGTGPEHAGRPTPRPAPRAATPSRWDAAPRPQAPDRPQAPVPGPPQSVDAAPVARPSVRPDPPAWPAPQAPAAAPASARPLQPAAPAGGRPQQPAPAGESPQQPRAPAGGRPQQLAGGRPRQPVAPVGARPQPAPAVEDTTRSPQPGAPGPRGAGRKRGRVVTLTAVVVVLVVAAFLVPRVLSGTPAFEEVVTIGVGGGPAQIALSPDGNRAYVTNHDVGTVSVINTTTRRALDVQPQVGAGPDAVLVAPDGRRVYVANSAAGEVSVLDTGTNAVPATIAVGRSPDGLAISPDGKLLYVANAEDGNVTVVDTATAQSVGAPIPVGKRPRGMAISPDGKRLYVAGFDSNDVTLVDTATATPIGRAVVDDGPVSVVVGPDGKRLFVVNQRSGTISVIDTVAQTSDVAAARVGASPTSAALDATKSHLYVTSKDADTIVRLDVTTLQAGPSFTVGDGPVAVAAGPKDGLVYVVGQTSSDVSVLRPVGR